MSVPVPVLIITGSVGVGKTTVGEAVHDILCDLRVPHAFIDADAFRQSWPPSGRFNTDLVVRNIASVWTNFRESGATRVVVADVIEQAADLDAYLKAIPGAEITVCRLQTSLAERQRRLKLRNVGASLDWHLNRTSELDAIFDEARAYDFEMTNEDADADVVASAVLATAKWVPSSTSGLVTSVNVSPTHTFGKPQSDSVQLIEGHGVQGDAHAGPTVKHRSRVVHTPDAPNLRQVHLVHSELHDELAAQGLDVGPGAMGENITTRGVDLLRLPTGTRLHLGPDAVVEVTGLRSPCRQLDGIANGVMDATLDRDADGRIVRKAGVMSVVHTGGQVSAGDEIAIELPGGAFKGLEPV